MDRHRPNQEWGGDLAVFQRWSCCGGSSTRIAWRRRRNTQMTEVSVDVMWPRVIELWFCGVHQDRHQTFEAPQGEIEHKGKLEAHQQG